MKRFKIHLAAYLCIGFLPLTLYSQLIDRQIIGFNGGHGQVDGKIISYTLGETMIQTFKTEGKPILTQGFFQPDKITVGTISIGAEALTFNLFPNPTAGQVQLDISSLHHIPDLEIQIVNVLGQVISPLQTLSSPSKTTLDCEQLPTGHYFLKINHAQQQKVLPFVKL